MARADIDEVIMGCVLPAGQGQAPARQASFLAGLSESVPATTVNKMCGSGMKAVMLAMDQLRAGHADMVVAGGMESMSNAPYLLPKMRRGARMGETQAQDHMFLDGLQDAYEEGRLMGAFAEDCAEKYDFSRQAQDDYALRSLSRAQATRDTGGFVGELAPIRVSTRKGEQTISTDEQLERASPDKIPTLAPAFKPNGTITAANASSISDGAAALVLMLRPLDGSRQRLSVQFSKRSAELACRFGTLICGKLTRPLLWSQWLRHTRWKSPKTALTFAAAPVHLDIPSVLQALGSL